MHHTVADLKHDSLDSTDLRAWESLATRLEARIAKWYPGVPCCCNVDESDGETILKVCGAHEKWRDDAVAVAVAAAVADRVGPRHNNPCPTCGGVGSARRKSDQRPRNCQDCKGTGIAMPNAWGVCEGCPPADFPEAPTRCLECPRRPYDGPMPGVYQDGFGKQTVIAGCDCGPDDCKLRPDCRRPKATMSESEGRDFVKEARARFRLDSNVSYPSRVAANDVRRFIHEIADAYERLRILYMATCAVVHRQKADTPSEERRPSAWKVRATFKGTKNTLMSVMGSEAGAQEYAAGLRSKAPEPDIHFHGYEDVRVTPLYEDVEPSEVPRHPEDFCQECSRPNVVWFAPNEIWNATNPTLGILCPVCFIKKAEAAGFDKAAWRIAPEDHVTPSPVARQEDDRG